MLFQVQGGSVTATHSPQHGSTHPSVELHNIASEVGAGVGCSVQAGACSREVTGNQPESQAVSVCFLNLVSGASSMCTLFMSGV